MCVSVHVLVMKKTMARLTSTALLRHVSVSVALRGDARGAATPGSAGFFFLGGV